MPKGHTADRMRAYAFGGPNPRIRIARPPGNAGVPPACGPETCAARHQAIAALQPCNRREKPCTVRSATHFNDSLKRGLGPSVGAVDGLISQLRQQAVLQAAVAQQRLRLR